MAMCKSCLAGPDHTRFRTLSYSTEISTLRMLVESVSYLVHGQTEGAMAFLSPLDLYPFFFLELPTKLAPHLT